MRKSKILSVMGIFMLSLLFCNAISAQQRTNLGNGITLVSYGNNFSIEDDKTKMCWNLSVTAEKKSTGELLYTVACKGYTRVILQSALHTGITAVLTSSGVGALGTGIVNSVAGKAYSDACDYYAKKYGH